MKYIVHGTIMHNFSETVEARDKEDATDKVMDRLAARPENREAVISSDLKLVEEIKS